MTLYQLFLLAVLITWPLVIFGVLFLMSRLEEYVKRADAPTPEKAGLVPVEGSSGEREVRIIFDERDVGEDTGQQPTLSVDQ